MINKKFEEEQKKLFDEIVRSTKINIVNCGNCGNIIFHQGLNRNDLECGHCGYFGGISSFPDFYY